ncbi:hypothetical protein DEI93_03920 [Curtobacterium sp. MCBD17_035]|uniref:hypothetical protein n=1 Tax=Curtobacterium sp. MCBD17_035 TaxID=2175673 RepID=UPI000DA88ECC|nr:hypothetical protein [Curtobacterium sp. MCBD17_035]WIB68199.1 hypothetical protein DEI93_03920 [Curtobacterium sp. MCBD17_035]
MSPSFTLPDTTSLGDLRTYLRRASRVEDGSVRLIAGGGVLAVYTAILYPVGLLDEVPTVLGLRTFALADPVEFDAVVPIASFVHRLDALVEEHRSAEERGLDPTAATAVTAELPLEVHTVTWAAISPPRGGWVAQLDIDARTLRRVAREGMAEVAEAVPTAAGDAVVRRVRAEVWGRPVNGEEHLPAGAAFAAESLGFLAEGEPVRLFETGPWSRLTTTRGHVLVKRRAWSLSR